MQASLCRPRTQCFTSRQSASTSTRRVAVQAKGTSDAFQRSAAAFGAALLLASPFAGPALARPSDFIQSKPTSKPGEATNVDKFPFSPSVSGQPARKDTSQITNPQKDPEQYSTTKGLGKAMTSQADGGSESGQSIPGPLDDGPNPDTTGSKGPGLDLNPFK